MAHFLEVLELNRRDTRLWVNNGHTLHLPDMAWWRLLSLRSAPSVAPSALPPLGSTWGYKIFITDAALASIRQFVPSIKGTMTLCY